MKTKQVLSIMKIISWIIFIGLCIKAGAIIITTFISFFINPEAARNLYLGLNMFNLYEFSHWYYLSMLFLIISILILKAYMFYLVIKIFSKIHINNPFSSNVAYLISKISYVALGIGVLSVIANSYKMWLMKKGFSIPLDFGAAEFLLMSGILFIIASLFKRGVEIQSENDLTI